MTNVPAPTLAGTAGDGGRTSLDAAMFRAFFDQLPFYAGIIAIDGTLLDASQVSLLRAGYEKHAVIGRKFWETPWFQGSDASRCRIREGFEVARGGRTFTVELPFYLSGGIERMGDVVMSPVCAETGELQFVVVTGIDITDRAAAAAELAATRRRLESALIAAELGIYEWDLRRNRVYGDRNFARLFSIEIDPVHGTPSEDLMAVLHPEDEPRVRQQVLQSIETGEDYETDYRIRRGQDYRWVTARGRMARDASGHVASFAGVVLDISDRKRAEEDRHRATDELQRQYRIYDTILSATNDFAYILDLQGRFLYANRALLELWARRLDQVVGKTFRELGYSELHVETHRRELAEVMATHQPVRGELPFTGADGVSRIYDYIFTPVLGRDGNVEYVAGTTRDVTERKRREIRDGVLIALDDATRPLTDSFDITQASARVLGEALQVNRCAYADVEDDEDTFNLTGDYNRDVPSIVGRYRFAQFGDECLRLMREGKPYIVEDAETDPRTAAVREPYRATLIRAVICVPLLKGQRFVAAMAVHQTTPRRWEPHEVELVSRVANRCWESIERTRVRRVLAESEQRLQLAVTTGTLGVCDLDLRTLAVTASDLWRTHYGRPAGAPFSHDDLWESLHPEDRARVREEVQRAISQRGAYDTEYRTVWPDGSLHWISARGQAGYGAYGTPLRLVSVSQDITQRKQDEQELEAARRRLEEHARSLEGSVRERTAKLQETISELEGFSYSISHDLRAPLRAMQSFASMLASDCADSIGGEGREYIRRIVAASERMDRLIQDVLVYSRIARNEIPVERIELGPFLAGILETYPQFSAASADFTVVPPLGAVLANPAALTQVVSNLLGNAIKFVPAGTKPAIRIWAEAHAGRLRLYIRDNGIGIDAALHDKIFGIFYQLDARRGGTGIGLSVVRKAAERMGGTVGLDSTAGKGSTFWIELPAPPPS